MEITKCKEVGYHPIKGADHKKPAYHFQLVPGGAYKRTPDGWVEVEIKEAEAKKAQYTFCLVFVHGVTMAEFNVSDDLVVAQPLPNGPAPKQPKAKIKEKSIVAKLKESNEGPKALQDLLTLPAASPPPKKRKIKEAKAESKQAEQQAAQIISDAPKEPPPKKAKGLRKKGYGLDL